MGIICAYACHVLDDGHLAGKTEEALIERTVSSFEGSAGVSMSLAFKRDHGDFITMITNTVLVEDVLVALDRLGIVFG